MYMSDIIEDTSNNGTLYVHIYADYLPIEFFIVGMISACITFINVICIFITAIIILKVIRLFIRINVYNIIDII
jgi:hypothetical protein